MTTALAKLPIVVDGVFVDDDGAEVKAPPTEMRFRISASQLKAFLPDQGGCPRKWALMYLGKVPKIQGQALLDGIVLHEAAADWFRLSGQAWAAKWPQQAPFDSPGQVRLAKLAVLAANMVQHAPPSKMARIVEGHDWLEVPELDTAFYFRPDAATDRKIVTDWKSTSAPQPQHPWVLQLAEWYMGVPGPEVRLLEDDVQARLYAHAAMTLWHTDRVTMQWVYGCKKFELGRTPRTWTVEKTFRRAETREWFEQKIVPAVRVMNALRAAWETRQLDSPLLVPHYGDSCEWTGKFCDALGHCLFQQSPIPLSRLALPTTRSNALPAADDDAFNPAALLHFT